MVALEVLQEIKKGIKASRFFDVFKKTPQVLENITIQNNNILSNLTVKKSIKTANNLIKNHGRILVRKSGTEPKIRIMVETENMELLYKCIDMIKKEIIKVEA